MAYSKNQNQLALWGSHFLGRSVDAQSASDSLKYWCATHKRVLDIGRSMGPNFYFLNYDDFCAMPSEGMEKLLNFLGLEFKDDSKKELIGLVEKPNSVERFRQHGTDQFDQESLAFVSELGFVVE